LTRPAEADGSGRSYALLADGTTLTIRSAGPGDYEAVKRLHEAMSPENLYFRFFSLSRVSAEWEARRVCLDNRPGMVALVGLAGDEVVGVASCELTGDVATAEAALAVAEAECGVIPAAAAQAITSAARLAVRTWPGSSVASPRPVTR